MLAGAAVAVRVASFHAHRADQPSRLRAAERSEETADRSGSSAAQVRIDCQEAGAWHSHRQPRARPSFSLTRVLRAQDYLVKTLLEGLPPLGERVKILRDRELARRGAAVENDIKSQSECVR